MLACLFVGRRVKPEKPLHPSSLSRPVNTAHVMQMGREQQRSAYSLVLVPTTKGYVGRSFR